MGIGSRRWSAAGHVRRPSAITLFIYICDSGYILRRSGLILRRYELILEHSETILMISELILLYPGEHSFQKLYPVLGLAISEAP